MTKIRIAIIGGGASGATACKACIEEGFDVVVYEKTHYTGGIWRYQDENVDGVPSVAKSTIINTSKEMSAFSNFPPPPEFPNFMHNTKMVKYYDLYGQQFGFERYIRFRHNVIKVEPNTDYQKTGKWIITVEDSTSGQIIQEVFNGVLVCTGHHVQPSVPTFKDQDKFKGQIIHSNSFKKPDGFVDKRVVVVGVGNSGCDAAVDLSTTAKRVYLSTRRGTWLFPRQGPFGKPMDSFVLRRSHNLIMDILPYTWLCSVVEYLVCNSRLDHDDIQLKPKHRALSQQPTFNDILPNRIMSGMVIVKHNIEKFTEDGVIFEGETTETECDVVLLATGYKIAFPFLSQTLIPTDNNAVQLYKYVFLPKLKHPKTLAFIALIQPHYPTLPVGEMQSRWFAQLMANKIKLPDFESMMRDIEIKSEFRKRFYESERHTIEADAINYMDELAKELGVKPNLLKYFFTDNKLWRALFFDPSVPYQYRLEGPHSWSGAREAILTAKERMSAPLKTRFREHQGKSRANKSLRLKSTLIGLIFFVLIAFLINNWI